MKKMHHSKYFFIAALIALIFSWGCFEGMRNNPNDLNGSAYTGPADQREWTIMIYLDGDNDLEYYALGDFNEMEQGIADAINAGNSDINENINILVLLDRWKSGTSRSTESGGGNWSDARLYRILPDQDSYYFGSERLDDGGIGAGHVSPCGEINMGDPATLSWFINHGKTYFPAEKYSLILWNHGAGAAKKSGGMGISGKQVCQDSDNGDDYLYLDEIQQSVSASFSSTNKLDILGFDACYMGMIEIAYEFRNLADYMVASMNWEQTDGWDYEYMFENMKDSRDELLITPENLSILWVEAYQDNIENDYGRKNGQTLSSVKLSEMENLKSKVDLLAAAIDSENKKSALETTRDNSVDFYADDTPGDETTLSRYFPFYDLYDLCSDISNDSGSSYSSGLKTAADNVITALASSIVYSYGEVGSGTDGNSQSYYYGAGSSTKRGLSIFFSRGNLIHNSNSHYAYQYWYTSYDLITLAGINYGNVDFCTYDNDGTVETWLELMEKWYDSGNTISPSTF
ncbi:MAG: hypothetical protein GY754_01705 [bacterium]|nr:hypothetical protein [bacterium]